VKALAQDWKTLPESFRKEYSREGMNSVKRSLDKQIPEREKTWKKQRNALWVKLKNNVRLVL